MGNLCTQTACGIKWLRMWGRCEGDGKRRLFLKYSYHPVLLSFVATGARINGSGCQKMAQLAEGLRQAAQLDKLQLQRPQGRQMAEVEPEDMDADFRAELLLVPQML